jgi:CIC family chloride channel protein
MQKESLIENDFGKAYIGQSLGDLIETVAHSKRNLFPVLNQKDELEGVILLDDIREIMFDISRYDSAIELFMQIPPAIINHTDTMQEIMDKFERTKAWNLPFIQENKYAGFISKSRMFNVYRKWLQKISDD